MWPQIRWRLLSFTVYIYQNACYVPCCFLSDVHNLSRLQHVVGHRTLVFNTLNSMLQYNRCQIITILSPWQICTAASFTRCMP